jgi:hypothetical protein
VFPQKLSRRFHWWPHTTRAEVDQLDAQLDATFRDMDDNFLDTRFRVKDFITKEEWAELSVRLKKR